MSKTPEPGHRMSREALIQERRALIERANTLHSEYDETLFDTLLTLPESEVSAVLKTVKRTIMKLLPVTRETRGYLAKHEIEAGSRLNSQVERPWMRLFEGLFETAFKRCPPSGLAEAEILEKYKAIDEHTYTSGVNYDLTDRYRTWSAKDDRYKNNQEEYLRLIQESTEVIMSLAGVDTVKAFDCLARVARNISRPKNSLSFESNELKVVEIYEDIFIALLSRLHEGSAPVVLQAGDLAETQKYVTVLVTNFTQKINPLEDRIVSLAEDRDRAE